MGSIKDRNCMDLTKAEDIRKRWKEYTEELYKKDLHDPVIMKLWSLTHLELDILECEVRWALGSITTNKASGGDRNPVELFQILKDDDVNMLHSICQKIWKSQQWPQDWKRSVFIPISKKGNAKECSNYHIIALISHASKVILKILQVRLQQYVNRMWTSRYSRWIQKRQRNQRSNSQHPTHPWKSKGIPEKHLVLLYWLSQSLWLCGPQQTVENS